MKKANGLIKAGLLLIAAALFLTGFNLWDNQRAGQAAEEAVHRLEAMIDEPAEAEIGTDAQSPIPNANAENAPQGEIEIPDYVLNPEMEMPVKQLDGEKYIGIVSIPVLDRELPVFAEWSYPKLRKAPCRYAGSVYKNNLVICAHNYGIHFGNIKNLKYGDTVIFTDIDGNVFNYRVHEIETLRKRQSEEMKTGDWDLTLFTCTIGGATRVTVRCEKIG